ncbi:UDP-glucuronosyl/UDP-glucosyltransferase [Macleaya cordata]|uniref:Glycosyltransferase n=1 Tax=Macleaya cordata TaxID=56857 RepID=A0A200R0H5_MACCD|nr:UDP-glucuronosyl/UDP-glucosyltransferase [Macleaya cordata]
MPSQLSPPPPPLSPPPLPPPPHVVIFPFMAHGHTIPLLDLSKALSSKSIKVTIITTPSNTCSILPYISNLDSQNINLKQIPFPQVQDIPIGCENTSQLPSLDLFLPFLNATKKLQPSFHQTLKEMSQTGSLPICVISDFFLGWTLDTCRSFDVPRIVFHGMDVLSRAISKTLWVHPPHQIITASSSTDYEFEEQSLTLPGLTLPFTLTCADLPQSLRAPDHNDPFSEFITEVDESDNDSWGVIVNSFVELEHSHVAALESFYKNGAKAWCVGPLLLYNDQLEKIDRTTKMDQCHTSKCIKWLTEQAMSASVIYVSFGTQVHVSDAQLDEVAFGLEMSGYSYLWVVRSKTWTPPDGMEGTKKGLIISDQWVDQLSILAHRGTGGFLSHCGWNSVLESLSMGVPILAWPMIAEQSLNAKLVVEGLGAAIRVANLGPGGVAATVGREAICEGVKELMGGERGRSVRERTQGLGRAARRAVEEGGSSSEKLSDLIDTLCTLKKDRSHC